MDQRARFTQQPAANFKTELPVSEPHRMKLLAAAEVKGQTPRQACTATAWLERAEPHSLCSSILHSDVALTATGRAAAALEYMHSGGKRGSKSRSELLDCFATCMSGGENRCRCLSGVGVRLNSCDGRHKCFSGVQRERHSIRTCWI